MKLKRYDITEKNQDGTLKRFKSTIKIKDGKFVKSLEYKKEDYDGKQGD